MASRGSRPCRGCKKMFGKCYVTFEFDGKGRCKGCAKKEKISSENTEEYNAIIPFVNDVKQTHN